MKAAKRRKCPLCGSAVKGAPTQRSGTSYTLRGSELENVTSIAQRGTLYSCPGDCPWVEFEADPPAPPKRR